MYRPLRRVCAATAALILACATSAFGQATAPATAPSADRTPAVERARQAATRFLLAQRRDGRQWEATAAPVAGDPGFAGRRWGVVSAEAAAALLERSDAPRQAQSVSEPLRKWLLAAPLAPEAAARAARVQTYRSQRRLLAPPNEYGVATDRLVAAIAAQDLVRRPPADPGDLSAAWDTNLIGGEAVLAVARFSSEVDCGTLDVKLDRQWRALQRADGSWGLPGSASVPDDARLTAQAVALLAVASPEASDDEPAIARALAWLDARDPKDLLRVDVLAALARAARATGRRGFGQLDLGGEGVTFVRGLQNDDGSFGSAADPLGRVFDTAHALSFLNAVDVPVYFASLRHGRGDGRTYRPNAGLAEGLSRWSCRTGAWRDVSIDDPDFAAVCDAPILVVRGTNPPRFDDARVGRLRAYVERGGLILGVADGGHPAFGGWFRDLAGRAFPGRAVRPLPPSSPAMNSVGASARKRSPEPVGVSNGVRELMVLVPNFDLAKRWPEATRYLSDPSVQVPFALSVYTRIGANSDDWPAWPELSAPPPPAKPVTATVRVGVVSPDPAGVPDPHAWRRVADELLRTDGLRVDPVAVDLKDGLTTLAPADVPLLHLTGTQAFTLSAAQRTALATYVRGGGTLLVDAAGGGGAFAKSVATELQATFGNDAAGGGAAMAATDPFLTAVTARLPDGRLGIRSNPEFTREPQTLQAVTVGGRRAVIFTPHDLTAGMAGLRHGGFVGFDPPTATAIVRQALLLATGR